MYLLSKTTNGNIQFTIRYFCYVLSSKQMYLPISFCICLAKVNFRRERSLSLLSRNASPKVWLRNLSFGLAIFLCTYDLRPKTKYNFEWIAKEDNMSRLLLRLTIWIYKELHVNKTNWTYFNSKCFTYQGTHTRYWLKLNQWIIILSCLWKHVQYTLQISFVVTNVFALKMILVHSELTYHL